MEDLQTVEVEADKATSGTNGVHVREILVREIYAFAPAAGSSQKALSACDGVGLLF